jgi:hypothetical protein
MANLELNVVTRGGIPWSVKREIENTLRDCYRKFSSRLPYKVDVFIVDREANMRAFLRDEKLKRGITVRDDDISICAHDAWCGYPRMLICFEEWAQLGKLARVGSVCHEAAHTVLHGSLEYCIFRMPDDALCAATIKGVDSGTLDQALYSISVAVKDFEATRLLINSGYIECQFAFGLESLGLSEQERAAWKSARENRQTRFIYLLNLLRPVLFAQPLLVIPRSNKLLEMQVYLGRRAEELVEHLGDAERSRFIQVTNMMTAGLTAVDTHKNVDFALNQAMSLV